MTAGAEENAITLKTRVFELFYIRRNQQSPKWYFLRLYCMDSVVHVENDKIGFFGKFSVISFSRIMMYSHNLYLLKITN